MFYEGVSIETIDMLEMFDAVFHDAIVEEAIQEQNRDSVIFDNIQDDINTSEVEI